MHPEVLVNTSVGESVTFQCTAESFGRPEALQYYWLEIVDNQPIPIVNATTNTLQFIAVAKDDSTLYQCAATNENATVFSNTGRLNGKYIHYYIHCTNVILGSSLFYSVYLFGVYV